jgi:hypothetical protein
MLEPDPAINAGLTQLLARAPYSSQKFSYQQQ